MDASLLNSAPITADGVRAAAGRLSGKAVRTPLLENQTLNDIAGGRVLLKAEVLQHYGSFKFRGAYNLISQLSEEERRRGILAWSSGNHAQGVALAARMAGAHATIIMPADAPAIKTGNVKALGAEIIFYDRYSEDREEIAERIIAEKGMVLAPSFDHPHIIEGQGTVALETFDEAQARGLSLDAFIVCCGGGGLTSGCALILEDASPETDVWIAEPEGFDETWASIRDGVRHRADVTRRTICDAIASPAPGRLTLPIMERLVRGGLTVTEEDVRRAMIFAWRELKLVVEPGGAAALAGLLSGKFDAKAKVTALTLSGGNVDAPLFAAILEDRALPSS
ncbi:threonine ammonia-lyase [Hyphococcus sp.]|uniref:threonine ammonia-lyase n=1 Tax=Hyphococcus sp. TaxID=2038636 RepID=UPI003D14B3EE